MSIKLAILEKKIQSLENAVSFLGDSLSMAFPSVGVSFDSISKGLMEVNDEIEIYKAEKVRAKRDDVFKHNVMLTRDDLNFLLRNYVPQLADLVSCDRVHRDPHRGGLRDPSYVIDMGNLNLETMENAINPHGLVSHSLKLLVSIGVGLEVYVEETVTVDMETITTVVPYDPELTPLIKWRVVNWFHDQVARSLPVNEWVLPTPTTIKDEWSSFTQKPRRVYPGRQIYVRLASLADKMRRQAEDRDLSRYGVAVRLSNKSRDNSTNIHVFVERDDEQWTMVLRDMDNRRPFGLHAQDINLSLSFDEDYGSETFLEFEKLADQLELRRLSRLCMILDQLWQSDPEQEKPVIRDADSNIYSVDWLTGPK